MSIDKFGNQIVNRNLGLQFDKKTVNFRIQQYIENKILACGIETPNERNASFPLKDRMWIKLFD